MTKAEKMPDSFEKTLIRILYVMACLAKNEPLNKFSLIDLDKKPLEILKEDLDKIKR